LSYPETEKEVIFKKDINRRARACVSKGKDSDVVYWYNKGG